MEEALAQLLDDLPQLLGVLLKNTERLLRSWHGFRWLLTWVRFSGRLHVPNDPHQVGTYIELNQRDANSERDLL